MDVPPDRAGTGEFALIAQLAPFLAGEGEGVAVGHGDDAAVLDVDGRLVCIAVDVVVDGVHFRRDVSAAEDVGFKAVAVNCSDLAAMGARPTAAVVGLCRPAAVAVAEVERIYAGMDEACRRWGLRLVGGDTVAAEALALSVTVIGEVPGGRPVRRSGAAAGDDIVLVGALGGAAAAVAELGAGHEPAPDLLAAHRRPTALVAAGQILAELGATAMIDVSDGLGADLGHVCEASGVAARVRAEALPLAAGVRAAAARLGLDPLELACGGGEDFALLATLPAGAGAAAAAAAGEAEGVPAAVIGQVAATGVAATGAAATGAAAVTLVLGDGTERDLAGLGYDHYAGARAEPPV